MTLKFIKSILCGLILSLAATSSGWTEIITDEAQQLFNQYQSAVYQIRVIDQATGKKSAIGSGFQISAEGHITTNYHVVSDAIQEPTRYRIEYLRQDGTSGLLKILDVDVVHDLAIVKTDDPEKSFLQLGESNLSHGTRIFSLGNPLDLGMSIVEGTYNGLMEKALYRKILFSGSLNPGMSGGPAIDRTGHVIGVNVSTGGNQISFLVPVEYLKEFYAQILVQPKKESINWDKRIEEELFAHQNGYIQKILDGNWDKIKIGEVSAPGEISPIFRCWGDSKEKEDNLYSYASTQCSVEDVIYLSQQHYTGTMNFQYLWFESKGLNTFRFYNFLERYFSETRRSTFYQYDPLEKDKLTDFQCHTDFVKIGGQDWKVGMCVRGYKKYSTLYDLNLSMVSINKSDRALAANLTIAGLSRARALQFVERFLKETQWAK